MADAHMADAHMADTHGTTDRHTACPADGRITPPSGVEAAMPSAGAERASAGQLDGGASDGDASKRCEGAKRAEAGTATSSGDARVLATPPPHVPAMPLMPPMLKLAVASGLRCLVGGLAEALPPPPPRRRRGGGPPPGSSVTPTELRADHPKAAAATTPIAPLTEEATATGIDQSIELYVGFQRRVVRRALRTAAELEATALEEADQDGVDGASGSAAHEGEGVQQQQHEEEQRDGEGEQGKKERNEPDGPRAKAVLRCRSAVGLCVSGAFVPLGGGASRTWGHQGPGDEETSCKSTILPGLTGPVRSYRTTGTYSSVS